jgi:hypothetical protein
LERSVGGSGGREAEAGSRGGGGVEGVRRRVEVCWFREEVEEGGRQSKVWGVW